MPNCVKLCNAQSLSFVIFELKMLSCLLHRSWGLNETMYGIHSIGLTLQWSINSFLSLASSRAHAYPGLLSLMEKWCGKLHPVLMCSFVYSLRKSTSFPETPERWGERWAERHVSVHCWWEVVSAWQALASGKSERESCSHVPSPCKEEHIFFKEGWGEGGLSF